MLIAAFDTSSASGSIALVRGRELVAEVNVGDVGTHADWLMGAFSALLDSVSLKAEDIDLFAVGAGPGSFTGLRIGVSTIKGLAWALGRKVVGVSTLEALAMNMRFSGMPVCPLLDARKGEVYTALYDPSGEDMDCIVDGTAVTPERLFEIIRSEAGGAPVAFLGDGLGVYEADVRENVDSAVIAPASLWGVRASNTAMIAAGHTEAAVEPGALSPVYLRKSQAEIKAAERAPG